MSDFLSPNLVVFLATIAAVIVSFYLATGRVRKQAIASQIKSHSLNQYYGFYVALWVLVPAILLALIFLERPGLTGPRSVPKVLLACAVRR